jgi:hypothetical protein
MTDILMVNIGNVWSNMTWWEFMTVVSLITYGAMRLQKEVNKHYDPRLPWKD